ncbi:MAG: AMP-binding protein [Alphaproteobacteria bacterium]|nr:AMP-binding protein [Alphaproteobacteria bacterium]
MNTSYLTTLLDDRAAAHGNDVALRQKRYGIWHEMTWAAVRETCRALGGGLAALGLQPGNRLAILADPSQEAVFMLLATHYAGGVPVLIHPTLPADETAQHFAASGCNIAYCDTVDRADKILPALGGDPGSVPRVIVLDSRDADDRADAGLVGFDTLLTREGEYTAKTSTASSETDDLTVTTLSSGTGATPRPLDLSHRSLVHAAQAFAEHFQVSAHDRSLATLPLGHPVELCLSLVLPLLTGMQAAFSESARTMQDDMIEIAPTIVVGPPRLWQKLRGDALLAAHRTGFLRRRLFTQAMGSPEHPAPEGGKTTPGFLDNLLITGALRARLGLRKTRVAISTGGEPVAAISRFFERMGLPIWNAYSVSEAGGIVATLDGARQAGSATIKPLPGFDVRLDDSEGIEVQAEDRWIGTDDLGTQSAAGLTLRGRAAERLPTAHAQQFESALKSDPLIREAVVLPDDANGTIAIIQPDAGLLGAWANRRQLQFTNFQSLVALPEVQQVLREVISASIAGLTAEQPPAGYVVLPYRLGLETGELTPLMAARRPVLAGRMKDLKEHVRPIGG